MKAEEIPGLYSSRQIFIPAASSTEVTHLSGLTGSAASVFASAHHKDLTTPSLFVLPDSESAAYFLDDIESLLGEKKALLFPSSFRLRHNIYEKDKANVLLRAETLSELSRQGSKAIVVTYPEAICEKVISNKELEQNTISLSRGDKFTIDFITEFLLEHGFENSDFVYEAG